MLNKRIDGSRGILEQDREYWDAIVKIAVDRSFDGCSGVTQLYQECCFAHDLHYADHKEIYGNPITRWQSDLQFLKDMQVRSPAGYLDEVAWKRFFWLRLSGWIVWGRGNR